MANGNIKNLFKSFLIFVIIFLGILSFVYLLTNMFLIRLVYENHLSITKDLIETAKHGVYNCLQRNIEELSIYSRNKDIINLTPLGKFLIDSIQKVNKERYAAVTRIDKTGKISYTSPYQKEFINQNVLYQEHNKKVFTEKRFVISKPFLAVQGFKAIALAHPVFKNKVFDGAFSYLLPFNLLYEEYLSDIKPTKNSFLIVFNGDGKIVYSPDFFKEFDNISNINKFFFIDDTSLIDSNQNFISLRLSSLNSFGIFKRNEKFILVKSHIEVYGTKWYIYCYSPEYEVKEIFNSIFRWQTFFIILVFILIVIVAIFFIKYLQERVSEDIEIFKEIFEEKNLTESEKEFYEKILSGILKTKDIYLFTIKEDGEIFFSNNRITFKKNFFDLILEEKQNFIKSSLNFVVENEVSKMVFIPIKVGKNIVNILFNITSFKHKENIFILLFGFEYNTAKEWKVSEDIFAEIFPLWYEGENPLCVIDKNGNIIVKNKIFEEVFVQKNIYEIFESEKEGKVRNILDKVNFGLENITLETQIKGKDYRIVFSPFFNQLLKVDYIYVKFE